MSRLGRILSGFPRVFWISNLMELFERWAWYGFYNAFALYLTLSKDTGALGFSQVEKGAIIGTGSMLLYLLPLITGAIGDKLGYKKMLILSFTAYIAGYFFVGYFDSYALVFAAYIFLAIAGALFKPIISGMIAKTTNEENSSIGFGIFYMMINIGGFIGPFVAGFLYKVSWDLVFLMSIITIAINYIFVFFFFKEPGREPSGKSFLKNIGEALRNIFTVLADWKYLLFLLIMAIFWTAFNQLYYTFPVFLEQWIDMNILSDFFGLKPGTITAVTVTSLDAFFIIAFQIIISSITMKYKPLHSIIGGFIILGGGLFVMFSMSNPWIIIFGVLIFGIGEMAASPKFTEYVGRIAPPDKKALYMGTSFLPLALGHYLAGIVSGRPFETIADKFYILARAAAEKGYDLPALSDTVSQTEVLQKAYILFGMDDKALTNYLWINYQPYRIWYLFAGIAFIAALFMFLYDSIIMNRNTK